MRKRGPGLLEDARNLTLIAVAAGVGLVGTGAYLAARAFDEFEREFEIAVAGIGDVGPSVVALGEWTPSEADPAPLLYGSVTTRSGDVFTGFLRWDRNEGGWADLLDADKRSDTGSVTQSGIRFGHLDRLEVTGSERAEAVLKSGEVVELESRSTDLGSALRALTVYTGDGHSFEFSWGAVESVDFLDAPDDVATPGGRLHGTLTTRAGDTFTGYITWDVDEIFTTDILDGDAAGQDVEIPFGAIGSITRVGGRAADVRLADGSEIRLHGSNDVDASNRGIAVADPGLGQVMVDWGEFESVRFHPPEQARDYKAFGEQAHLVPLTGEVVTTDGSTIRGTIAWDADEVGSWELLNGSARGAEFHVEFSQIASIRNLGDAAEVQLRDGRSFELNGSNDVDEGNRGVVIRAGGDEVRIPWSRFEVLRLGAY